MYPRKLANPWYFIFQGPQMCFSHNCEEGLWQCWQPNPHPHSLKLIILLVIEISPWKFTAVRFLLWLRVWANFHCFHSRLWFQYCSIKFDSFQAETTGFFFKKKSLNVNNIFFQVWLKTALAKRFSQTFQKHMDLKTFTKNWEKKRQNNVVLTAIL